MSNDKQLEFQRKIQALRATFLEQLPGRVAEAQGMLDALVPGHAPDTVRISDLHRLFHTIKGTSNSFGLKELAVIAATGEAGMEAVVRDPAAWDLELMDRIRRCLEALRYSLEHATVEPPAGTMPHSGADGSSAPAGCAEPPATRSALIYLCDDDQAQVDLLGSQLQYFGYRVQTFTDPVVLGAAVLAQKPDAVVMDIMFPGGAFQGTEVLGSLQDQGCRFPSIIVSGRFDFEARIRAIRAGGVAFFTKPVEALDLLGILDRLTSQTIIAPYKILIIDDELAIAQYHSFILENAGMVVQIVQNPETILDAVTAFRPDLVLMDMYMPYCTGREAAALIRQIPEFLSLPIIFLSGETDKHKQFSAMSVGVEGFLTKPIQADDLVNSVMLSADRMRALQSLMTKDSLTGLFNHTTTTQILESTLSSARRTGSTLCFAMIDLDRFKSVNDSYGHPMGDQVLLAMSRVLRQRLRVSDVVGRYGGEEFAVILGDIGRQAAVDLMDSLRLDFSRIVFHGAGQPFSCTFSCGIADSLHHDSVDALREAADRALYAAKHGGRNRIVMDGEEVAHGS